MLKHVSRPCFFSGLVVALFVTPLAGQDEACHVPLPWLADDAKDQIVLTAWGGYGGDTQLYSIGSDGSVFAFDGRLHRAKATPEEYAELIASVEVVQNQRSGSPISCPSTLSQFDLLACLRDSRGLRPENQDLPTYDVVIINQRTRKTLELTASEYEALAPTFRAIVRSAIERNGEDLCPR